MRRAVTFDCWNTLLVEPEPGALDAARIDAVARVLGARGAGVARVEAAIEAARATFEVSWQAGRRFVAADAAALVGEVLADEVSSRAGRDDVERAYRDASERVRLVAVPGAREALEALSERGVALGIVCDVGLTPGAVLRRELDRLGLLRSFSHWSFSDDVGVYKPDRRIFEHALEGLGGVAPGDAWHVGDRRRTDIAGAAAMGMGTVRFTGVFDDTDPDQGPSGDAVCASYPEVLDVLTR